MTEAVHNSVTSISFYATTQLYIADGCHLRTRRRENLKSHMDYHHLALYNYATAKVALNERSVNSVNQFQATVLRSETRKID
jgi:hypothetical protein